MSEHNESQPHGNDSVKFEPTDVATRPVVTAVVSLAAFTVTFTFVAHLVFHGLADREQAASPPASPLAAEYAVKLPPEPRLQEHPKLDLDVLRAAEEKTLSTLAWVDRDAGIVQVPIERAMEMLLAKGLAARQGPVPLKMSPHGVAPAQMHEGAGAPDWFGGQKIGHATEGGHEEAAARGAASHAATGQEEHGH